MGANFCVPGRSRQREALLLRDGFHSVSDFETRAGYRDGDRGNVIHFGDLRIAAIL